MKIYHLLLLIWIFWVTLWVLREVAAADRRRKAKERK